MNTVIQRNSRQARQNIIDHEGQPVFLCNWVRFVLIHYEVNAELLQDAVPFELDLFERKAFVSLVAFTLEDFSFAHNGIIQRLAMLPVRTHRYFNVRTYIKYKNHKGIYFIKEWISNKLCAMIGANLYGLPCEQGQLEYNHEWPTGVLRGEVVSGNCEGKYQYRLCCNPQEEIAGINHNTLEEFLFERYMAFVENNGQKKCFRIWHEPWRQVVVDIEEIKDQLMPFLGLWGEKVKLAKAHYSPGVYGVWMGRPLTLG